MRSQSTPRAEREWNFDRVLDSPTGAMPELPLQLFDGARKATTKRPVRYHNGQALAYVTAWLCARFIKRAGESAMAPVTISLRRKGGAAVANSQSEWIQLWIRPQRVGR
jgi:hypothetical protein